MSDERRDLDADFADEEDRVNTSVSFRLQEKTVLRPGSWWLFRKSPSSKGN